MKYKSFHFLAFLIIGMPILGICSSTDEELINYKELHKITDFQNFSNNASYLISKRTAPINKQTYRSNNALNKNTTGKKRSKLYKSNHCISPVKILFNIGYFYPWNKTIRKIYPNGNFIYKAEIDVRLISSLYVFGLGDCFTKKGNSIGERDKTRINLAGFSLGLQYAINLKNKLSFVFGIGPKYFYFNTKDNTNYLPRKTTKNGLGGIAKASMEWYINKFFLNIFTDYTYNKMHFKARPNHKSYYSYEVQIGGFSIGAGLGYAF